jgi:hypothetical protein
MADPISADGHSPFIVFLLTHRKKSNWRFFFGATSKQLTWAHLGPASVRRNSPSPFLPGKATPGLFFVAKDSIVREEKSWVRCEWWNLMRQIWDFWVTLGCPFNGWDTQCSD